jgi:hypothetical protein
MNRLSSVRAGRTARPTRLSLGSLQIEALFDTSLIWRSQMFIRILLYILVGY